MTGRDPTPSEVDAERGLRVRRAAEADAAGLLHLSLEAIAVTAAEYYTAEQLAAWAALRTLRGHERMVRTTHVILAEVDGDLAGFANLDVARSLVDQLFVAPASGRTGVASTLLARIEDAAREAGLHALTAFASKRAVRVFERCGYRRTRIEHVPLGNQVLERYEVRKDVPRPQEPSHQRLGSGEIRAGSPERRKC